jgi:hypothetical protein
MKNGIHRVFNNFEETKRLKEKRNFPFFLTSSPP